MGIQSTKNSRYLIYGGLLGGVLKFQLTDTLSALTAECGLKSFALMIRFCFVGCLQKTNIF